MLSTGDSTAGRFSGDCILWVWPIGFVDVFTHVLVSYFFLALRRLHCHVGTTLRLDVLVALFLRVTDFVHHACLWVDREIGTSFIKVFCIESYVGGFSTLRTKLLRDSEKRIIGFIACLCS